MNIRWASRGAGPDEGEGPKEPPIFFHVVLYQIEEVLVDEANLEKSA